MNTRCVIILATLGGVLAGLMQAQAPPSGPYVPGVTYQTTNPAYHGRSPFYFEGRVDWDLLKITTPSTAWEFAQRGIHEQDDLEDVSSAIADYQQAISMNSLDGATCQLITTQAQVNQGANLNPPPCMFTMRLRLGRLLKDSDPKTALHLFNEVLTIDPLRLGVNALIGETYRSMADAAAAIGDAASQTAALQSAATAYQAELALSPVTTLMKQLTGDLANNAHVHWSLSEVYTELGQKDKAAAELDLYLKATQWHSDTYPWRIDLAKKRLGN